MLKLKHNPLKSKTFWGALLAAASLVVSNPKDPTKIVEALGIVLAAIGLRDAAEKPKEEEVTDDFI